MFLVCGEALFDVFIEGQPAFDANTLSFSARVGGSPFNVAVGLARLGRKSSLLTGISTDFFGDRLEAVLKKEAVSTQQLCRKDGPTTLGFVQKNENGLPQYAFYGNGAADRSLENGDIEQDFGQLDCIHLGSYSIVVAPTADTLESLVKKHAGKCLISLDPNIRPTVEPNMSLWRERIDSLVKYLDVIKASDEDIEHLYPGKSIEDVARAWLDAGVRCVAVTRGGEGALLMSQSAKAEVQAPRIQVEDTVGAGDTFQTGLLDQLVSLSHAEPESWPEQLNEDVLMRIGQFAATAAAITCSRKGADLPNRDQIKKLLAEGD